MDERYIYFRPLFGDLSYIRTQSKTFKRSLLASVPSSGTYLTFGHEYMEQNGYLGFRPLFGDLSYILKVRNDYGI